MTAVDGEFPARRRLPTRRGDLAYAETWARTRRGRLPTPGRQTVEEPDPPVTAMTRSTPWRSWPPARAVAVLALAVSAVLAPAGVRAGCSHLVTSRSDRVLLPSLLQDDLLDRGRTLASADPLPLPRFPDPCRGMSCGDGRSSPTVPTGMVRIRAGSWAWSPPAQYLASPPASRILEEAGDPHPARRTAPIFRPPRLAV